MKRVLAVFLVAAPMWVASGVAGWWVGGGGGSRVVAPDLATKRPVEAPPSAARVKAPALERIQAAKPITPIPARAAPRIAATKPLPGASPSVPVAPPTDASDPGPIVSLGSTDMAAPEKVLAPADASASSKDGVLIVVSLASQKAFVFKDGELWGSTAVSTGKKGKRTPVGRYTSLETQVHHRSRTSDNAPMPYMRRLTGGGVALHAGHVTGRPASHGCIRLPRSFAKRLYNLTDFSSTTVVVTEKKARSSDEALGAA